MATDAEESLLSKSTDEKQFGGAQKLCDAFIALNIGELFRYADIAELIGNDPQDGRGRQVCLRAIDMALRKHGVKIVCMTGEGYQRVGFEGRREWITAKGESVQRINVKRFLTASHIEDQEFQLMTTEEKQKLAESQARVGMELAIRERLNKIKKVPPLERVKLVDLSGLGQIFKRKV